ncbi:hypothetical protein [Flavobacterium lipolyticum]|uniref:Uncharacterized protein n=2 Tax=Flavobacterium TaxID=237 RepID=A0ABS8LWE2_9FLAO|nr:hypothetical protein [Flavobacterium sp. F-126]MCC9016298.1 hypothetical protein [Flavobacterium sp. F-126]
MNSIYHLDTLQELKEYLEKQDQKLLREELINEFLKFAEYKNASDWNNAVKICESLAIVGWGKHEPLQAVKGMFFNGNPETCFINKFREPRFVDAIWSKRKDGFTMEKGRTSYFESPMLSEKKTILNEYYIQEDIQDLALANQRNWIPKNPILITRTISNCYENSKSVIESIDKELQPELDLKMKPEKYGTAINQIVFSCSYSFYDNNSCKTNYIIADESLKLKQKDFYPELLKIFSKQEIESNGYFLRNRYEYGNFNSQKGKIVNEINFEKELSDLSYIKQKQAIAKHILISLNATIEKLKKKKISYDFESMQNDFLEILTKWKLS